jgi:hypothetical protein
MFRFNTRRGVRLIPVVFDTPATPSLESWTTGTILNPTVLRFKLKSLGESRVAPPRVQVARGALCD